MGTEVTHRNGRIELKRKYCKLCTRTLNKREGLTSRNWQLTWWGNRCHNLLAQAWRKMAFRTKWENNGLEVTLSCKESNNVVLSPTAMVHGRLGCLIEEGTRKAVSWRESQVPLRVRNKRKYLKFYLLFFFNVMVNFMCECRGCF